MKTTVSILRGAAFTALCYLFMFLVYAGYNEYTDWVIGILGKIQHMMPRWLFWIIFLFTGAAILKLMWVVVKFTAVFILLMLSKISPSHKFSLWVVGICAAWFCIPFVVTMCQNSEGWFQWIITFVICSTAVYLAYSFVYLLHQFELDRLKDEELLQKGLNEPRDE